MNKFPLLTFYLICIATIFAFPWLLLLLDKYCHWVFGY